MCTLYYHRFRAKLSTLSTSPQVPLNNLRLRSDIEIKDINRQPKRRASIRNVHDARNMSLHRSARQQKIDLVVVISIPPQVLNDSQAGLSISHCGVEIVLFSVFIDTETFEVDVATRTELRLDWAGNVDGATENMLVGK